MIIDDDFPMIMEREAGLSDQYPALGVGFGLVPHQSPGKSKQAGYPVFEDREYVKIVIPGDKQSTVFQPATDKHKQRFPIAYAAFKRRETKESIEGMPIEQWPQVTRSLAMTLKAANIFTVEALAAIHDGNIDKIGSNGRDLRAKAQAFLAIAKDAAAAQQIKAESDRKDQMLADMQRQINDLGAQLQTQKRGPGRPRKEEAA